MATEFGGIACNIINCTLSDPTERLETWEHKGIDSEGVADMALGVGAFKATLHNLSTDVDFETWKLAIANTTKDGIIEVTDSFGTVYSNLVPKSMQLVRKKRILHLGTNKIHGVIVVSGIQTE